MGELQRYLFCIFMDLKSEALNNETHSQDPAGTVVGSVILHSLLHLGHRIAAIGGLCSSPFGGGVHKIGKV